MALDDLEEDTSGSYQGGSLGPGRTGGSGMKKQALSAKQVKKLGKKHMDKKINKVLRKLEAGKAGK